MELKEAERNAKALMLAHGVGSLVFAFDGGKRRIGATHFRTTGPDHARVTLPVKITLSRHFVALLSDEEIRDTMLHEIAHALAGKDAGHGPVWRAQARKLGIPDERCKATTAAPECAWEGYCPNGHGKLAQMHRAPGVVRICSGCAGRPQTDRILVWKKNGKVVEPFRISKKYGSMYTKAILYGRKTL